MIYSVFTVRPMLLQGESLWSYLFRLSDQNGIPLLRLLNEIKTWQFRYIQRTDFGLLNFSPGSIMNMEELSELTGYSKMELLSATFDPILSTFGVSDEVEHARFLSGMIMSTYRFCPLCIKESPYYRLLWEMAPIVACIHHKVFLVEKCPQCRRSINIRDVKNMILCPHCDFLLTDSPVQPISGLDLDKQTWMNDAFQSIIHFTNTRIEPKEVALRILYLLGDKHPLFDRQKIAAILSNTSVLPTLLQHARDSLSQKRTLHLSFLLNTLHEHHFSMTEFLQTTVPGSFVKSARQGIVRRADQLSCLAPWCHGYQWPGTLVKSKRQIHHTSARLN